MPHVLVFPTQLCSGLRKPGGVSEAPYWYTDQCSLYKAVLDWSGAGVVCGFRLYWVTAAAVNLYCCG